MVAALDYRPLGRNRNRSAWSASDASWVLDRVPSSRAMLISISNWQKEVVEVVIVSQQRSVHPHCMTQRSQCATRKREALPNASGCIMRSSIYALNGLQDHALTLRIDPDLSLIHI